MGGRTRGGAGTRPLGRRKQSDGRRVGSQPALVPSPGTRAVPDPAARGWGGSPPTRGVPRIEKRREKSRREPPRAPARPALPPPIRVQSPPAALGPGGEGGGGAGRAGGAEAGPALGFRPHRGGWGPRGPSSAGSEKTAGARRARPAPSRGPRRGLCPGGGRKAARPRPRRRRPRRPQWEAPYKAAARPPRRLVATLSRGCRADPAQTARRPRLRTDSGLREPGPARASAAGR